MAAYTLADIAAAISGYLSQEIPTNAAIFILAWPFLLRVVRSLYRTIIKP